MNKSIDQGNAPPATAPRRCATVAANLVFFPFQLLQLLDCPTLVAAPPRFE